MSLAFVPTSDPIWDTVSKVLIADYPNMCICTIERVVNPAVRAAFEDRRRAMQEAQDARHEVLEVAGTGASDGAGQPDGLHERVLFHGTKEKHIRSIVREGFLVAENRVSAFGLGTYFATSAAMSAVYTDVARTNEMSYMFVCRVLVGRCATDHHVGALDTSRFDNSTNGGRGFPPTIFTAPTDDGAYPEYLVAFYRSTK